MKRRSARIAFAAVAALLASSTLASPALAQDKAAPAAKPTAARPAIAAEPVPPRVDGTFQLWDRDRNGVLSLQEFRNGWVALRRDGVRLARQRVQFGKVDANDDGAIDAGEYPDLLLVKNAGKTAPALAAFDADRDGRLQFAEYQALVRKLAPQRAGRRPAASTTGAPASKGNTK